MSKELLLKQVELLKERQKEENELIEKLQKQIEDIDKESKIWWTPKVDGEDYYFIDRDGGIKNFQYDGCNIDTYHKDNLNMYKTYEEAKRVAFEQLLHRKLVKFAFENNDKEIDWNDSSKSKYHITYDSYRKQITHDTNQTYIKQGIVYFTSAEIVEKAMKEFNKDLIRYFTTTK